MMRLARSAALAALVWLNVSTQVVAKIDIPKFEETDIFQGESFPTDFTWTPGGQMLVTLKRGTLLIYDQLDGDDSFTKTSVALDLSSIICDNSERGLGGVQVHPYFGNGDRWIYLFYTFKKNGNCDQDQFNGPVNRLSRFWFQEGSNTIDKSSEEVLFDTPPLGFRFHNGGKIEFGKDGYLYVTVGESGLKEVAQSKSNLLGSLIRIKDDGGIPDDNPYNGPNDVRCYKDGIPPQGSPDGARCKEIYSIGLRNPFRMAMDPNTSGSTTRCFINDVGASTWEEINEGCGDIRDVNYGYPRREGPCRHSRTSGCEDTEGYTNPIHFYQHVGSEGQGGAATAGAFIPNDIGWPGDFYNGYLYADFVFGQIYLMKDDGKKENLSGSPPTSRMTISKFAEYKWIISMRFGPYNGKSNSALYYTSSEMGGTMRRIAYVGDDNYHPVAVIDAEPWSGQPGIKVQFSAARSSDSDNDFLYYEWDFNNDGTTDSQEISPSYTYLNAGVYTVKLTVSDGNGAKGTSTVQIAVGGDPPKPVITSHQGDATFAVGDPITLTGYATDNNNDNLSDESLEWEVRQHHGTHFHPYLVPTKGNNIQVLPAPSPEDYYAATNSYLEIRLTATDRDGISAVVSQLVQPRKVLVEFDTYPSGLEVFLDGTRIVTPATATTWERQNLEVDAPKQDFGGKSYTWKSWSNGGAQTQTITIPPQSQGLPKLIATFESNSVSDSGTNSTPDTTSCSYEALMYSDTVLWANGVMQNEKKTLYILQQDDGNLVVRAGTPDLPGEFIWQSGISMPKSNSYYTKLQGDGHLMTRKWISDTEYETIWKTKVSGTGQAYYLAAFVDTRCGGTGVSIIAPATSNVLWTSYAPPSNPGACTPRPLLFAGDIVKRDEVVQQPGTDAFILQESNGNLMVTKGWPDNPGVVVWRSGINLAWADYYTKLQGDGNLVTRLPSEIRGTVGYVWKSNVIGASQDYFLGLNCDGASVSVYEGTPISPGIAIWTSPAQF